MKTLPDDLRCLPIAAITPDGEEDCLCIAVNHPSRCYVTSSGIVTHNTDTTTPADRLPPNPRRLLDELLAGHSIEEAATAAGLSPERAPDIARNVGRFLANEWNRSGIDEESALRQLQQRATERHLPSPPAPPTSEGPPLAAGPRVPSPPGSIFYNRADKWLTGKEIG